MLLELTLATIDGQRCVDDVARAAVEFNTRAPPVEPHIEICTFHSAGHGTCNVSYETKLAMDEKNLVVAEPLSYLSC